MLKANVVFIINYKCSFGISKLFWLKMERMILLEEKSILLWYSINNNTFGRTIFMTWNNQLRNIA